MPPDKRDAAPEPLSQPARGSLFPGHEDDCAVDVTDAEAAAFVAGLRRRREAARRLAPLSNGVVDSWEGR